MTSTFRVGTLTFGPNLADTLVSAISRAAGSTAPGGLFYSWSINSPPNIVAGNLLIAVGAFGETAPIWNSVPAGFTQYVFHPSTHSNKSLTVWTKTATNSEPASYTWDSANVSTMEAAVIQVKTAAGTIDADVYLECLTVGSIQTQIPSATPTVARDLWLGIVCPAGANTIATPIGMTLATSDSDTSSHTGSIAVFSAPLASTSPTASPIATLGVSDGWVTESILVKP